MRVLGVVIARGGSKGVARKNVAPLHGKPLLDYTAEAALAAEKLSRVILTTENDEIAAVGRAAGLEVPFRRPDELARDETPSLPVIQHAVQSLLSDGDSFDAVMTLQPTNPLRRASDIDGAIEMLAETGADSVISFVDVGEKHPARMKYIDPNGQVIDPPFAEQFEGQRRQDLPPIYLREGSIYLTRSDVLMNQDSFKGADCRAWLIPPQRACNIDTPYDFALAEWLLASGMLDQDETT